MATPAGLRTLDTDTDTGHSGEVVSKGKMIWVSVYSELMVDMMLSHLKMYTMKK